MYGIPQVGSNSHNELKERLNKEGYFKSPLVPDEWKEKTCTTQFVLIVDNFGIKFFTKDIMDHLADTLKNITASRSIPTGKSW